MKGRLVHQFMNLGLLKETMFFVFCFFSPTSSFTLKSTRNNCCKSIICFMRLIVRLQSDPQSEWVRYDYRKCLCICALKKKKKKGAADLTKQMKIGKQTQVFNVWCIQKN